MENPSTHLLDGKGIWKVKFYHSSKVKSLLLADSSNVKVTNDELFSVAMRKANGQKMNALMTLMLCMLFREQY